MKKLLAITTLLLFAGIVFGQTLQKGNAVVTQVLNVDLKPDVTIDQWKEFFISKVIPELEKHYTGANAYLTKGIRGEHKNSLGLIVVFKTKKERDKFFNEDDSPTELGKTTAENFSPVNEELEKLGTYTRTYSVWMIL
jgi:hypothetical protein